MSASRLVTTGVAIAALAVAAVAPDTAAAKATGPGRHTVIVEEAYVTKQPGRVFDGTLFEGQTFKVTRLSRSGKYAYGFAYGHVNRRAWIEAAALSRRTAAARAAAAGSADIELRGAPTLRLVDARRAQLRFATDRRLPRTREGVARIRVRFAGGRRVSSVVAAGRHGSDYVYTARVRSDRDLRVGAKYTVRFLIADRDAIVRQVKLHDRSS